MRKTSLVILMISQLFGQNGLEIAKMFNSRKIPKDLSNYAKMILINAKGKVRSSSMISKSINGSKKQIIWFTEPKDDRGIAFLKIEHKSKADEIRIWLPAFKKARRISSKKKGDRFMGSDLSYEDLSNRDLDENTYLLLDVAQIDGKDYFVLETKPLKSNPSSYSKHISWIEKDNLILIKEHSYDENGQLKKEKKFEYQRIENYYIIKHVFVKDRQSKRTTEILFSNIKVDLGLDQKLFQEKNLKRLPID